ncbi:MAG: acyltransferase [Lentisphaeria bacterium]|nr:acyltransferase [Lentisphaeria bacterium]
MERREYIGIDLLKLLCAFMVVAIHTKPLASYDLLDNGLGILTRMAVPFFFTASGYFLFLSGKRETSGAKLCMYVKRIGILYCLWSIAYLPLLVNKCMPHAAGGGFAFGKFFRAVFWMGVSGHFWFLIGTIVASVMVWGCYRFMSSGKTLAVATAFLIFGTMCSTYRPLVENLLPECVFSFVDAVEARSGIFYGFFYVALGAFFACRPIKERGASVYAGVWLCGLALLAAESLIAFKTGVVRGTILWLTCPLAVAAFFLWGLNAKLPISSEKATKFRNASTLIYTSHCLFMEFFKSMGMEGSGLLLFATTSILSVIATIISLALVRRWKFLRYLY